MLLYFNFISLFVVLGESFFIVVYFLIVVLLCVIFILLFEFVILFLLYIKNILNIEYDWVNVVQLKCGKDRVEYMGIEVNFFGK